MVGGVTFVTLAFGGFFAVFVVLGRPAGRTAPEVGTTADDALLLPAAQATSRTRATATTRPPTEPLEQWAFGLPCCTKGHIGSHEKTERSLG
jgi:hypothetical protein